MPKQPHANKKNNLCGAKTRAGHPCKNRAMPNGRCRMHGGSSTGPPKRNQNAKRHGFFSKHIPKETLEIMDSLGEVSPADLIWDQIMIQYAAIIRAQQIMYVEDKDEIVKVLKKKKDSDFAEEREWEFQFAWDRHATFLNAQSRAIAELRTSVRQFLEISNEDDERRLKLEQMQLNVDKTKAEIEQIQENANNSGAEDWVSAIKEVAEKRKQVKQHE